MTRILSTRLALFATLASLLSGCGSLSDLAEDQRIYGGARRDIEYLFDVDGPWKEASGWKLGMVRPLIAPLVLLDIPLSAAFDTVALPITAALTLQN